MIILFDGKRLYVLGYVLDEPHLIIIFWDVGADINLMMKDGYNYTQQDSNEGEHDSDHLCELRIKVIILPYRTYLNRPPWSGLMASTNHAFIYKI